MAGQIKGAVHLGGVILPPYLQPLDPRTMKNEGFKPLKYGLYPLKMKVMGSHRRVYSTGFWGPPCGNL